MNFKLIHVSTWMSRDLSSGPSQRSHSSTHGVALRPVRRVAREVRPRPLCFGLPPSAAVRCRPAWWVQWPRRQGLRSPARAQHSGRAPPRLSAFTRFPSHAEGSLQALRQHVGSTRWARSPKASSRVLPLAVTASSAVAPGPSADALGSSASELS